MSEGDNPNKLVESVAKAEKAVADLKDPKLREIAFDRILSHLLEEGEPDAGTNLKRKKASAAKRLPKASDRANKLSGPTAWLRELADEGFFANPKSREEVLDELESRSHHLNPSDLSRPLEKLCHERILRRKKITLGENGKEVLHWSNW